jgi:hypothetical protein
LFPFGFVMDAAPALGDRADGAIDTLAGGAGLSVGAASR